MNSIGRTYSFRTSDGRSFRLPPGAAVVVGRAEGVADILFPHAALSRRHSRLVNSGDACTIECLMNRWWVKVNGRTIPTTGVALQAGDTIELVAGLSLIVGVEAVNGTADA